VTADFVAHAPVVRELTDADIEWELPPAPPDIFRGSLEDLIVEALVEAQAYRLVASAAIHQAHGRHVELEQLRAQHARLLEHYRELRRLAGTGVAA
jgi:hypothetical protein